MNPLSLQMLSMRSVINNNVNFSCLSDSHIDMIYFEMHKMRFKPILKIFDIIYQDMKYTLKDFVILKIRPVENDNYEGYDDDEYKYIWIKCVYNDVHKTSTKFIQELGSIEFDIN